MPGWFSSLSALVTPALMLALYRLRIRYPRWHRAMPFLCLLGADLPDDATLDSIDGLEKEEMRQLAMRGGPYDPTERLALLDYCQSDVTALGALLTRMTPHLDMPRALLRGRYMVAAARIEHNGIPLDVDQWIRMQEQWPRIQEELIGRIDPQGEIYEGKTFSQKRFAGWLESRRIAWR